MAYKGKIKLNRAQQALLLLFAVLFQSCASSPSKEETQSWIISELTENATASKRISFSFIDEAGEGYLVIKGESSALSDDRLFADNRNFDSIAIPLKEIEAVTFSYHSEIAEDMNIKTKSKSISHCKYRMTIMQIMSSETVMKQTFSVAVRNDVKQDGTDQKLIEAFARLVEDYGGSTITGKPEP